MDEIHYAGNVVVTGTDIARALLEYAHVLAENKTSATIDIPVYREDGTPGHSEFLLGPASQLSSNTVDTDWEELTDPEKLAELQHASRTIGSTRAVPVDLSDSSAATIDFPDFGEL
jgi:hypothetical protein